MNCDLFGFGISLIPGRGLLRFRMPGGGFLAALGMACWGGREQDGGLRVACWGGSRAIALMIAAAILLVDERLILVGTKLTR